MHFDFSKTLEDQTIQFKLFPYQQCCSGYEGVSIAVRSIGLPLLPFGLCNIAHLDNVWIAVFGHLNVCFIKTQSTVK